MQEDFHEFHSGQPGIYRQSQASLGNRPDETVSKTEEVSLLIGLLTAANHLTRRVESVLRMRRGREATRNSMCRLFTELQQKRKHNNMS